MSEYEQMILNWKHAANSIICMPDGFCLIFEVE